MKDGIEILPYAEFIEGQWVLNSSDGIIANGTYTVTENNANFEKYTRVTSVTVDGGNPNTFTQGNGETDPSADITMSGYQGTIAITNAYTRLLVYTALNGDNPPEWLAFLKGEWL